jgi:hypothetical protein
MTVQVTAGPYVDREGRWTLVARQEGGSVIHHISLRDKHVPGALSERLTQDLIRGLAAEFNITIEDATVALLTHTRKATAS